MAIDDAAVAVLALEAARDETTLFLFEREVAATVGDGVKVIRSSPIGTFSTPKGSTSSSRTAAFDLRPLRGVAMDFRTLERREDFFLLLGTKSSTSCCAGWTISASSSSSSTTFRLRRDADADFGVLPDTNFDRTLLTEDLRLLRAGVT